MPLIIDGHNLLHSIKKVTEGSESISEVRLCQIISEYLRLTDEKGEIVFDGTGPQDKSLFDNINTLEVFFAGLGSDADAVIESKIKASTAPKRLTIVSADRRLWDAARGRKAAVVKSQVFWEKLCRRLSRKKAAKEPPAKHLGITESETEQWLKLFELE